MIDTNLKGLLYVTRSVSPFMVARNQGHVINISSIAGKELYENGNVYCASKHAVEALSKGMRIDLLKNNIKVTINPFNQYGQFFQLISPTNLPPLCLDAPACSIVLEYLS